jgi:hypothetical protein
MTAVVGMLGVVRVIVRGGGLGATTTGDEDDGEGATLHGRDCGTIGLECSGGRPGCEVWTHV